LTKLPTTSIKYYSGNQTEKNEMGGHVARIGKRAIHTGFWWGYLRESDHLGDPGVDGRIVLKWIFKKWDGHGLD
jgi:hypothetical protein